MIRKITMLGAVVALVSALSLCVCFADGVDRLSSNIAYESETGMESIASKIKQKTGKDKVIVRVNKITKAPHSIIASGLEISSQDKVNIKSAIDSFKSKRVDKKMRLKGEALSDPQKKIDAAARAFIRNNKDILSADEANLKLINIQKVRSKAYVTYQQYYKDIPVYQAIVKVIISKEGKIPSLGSDYHKDIDISTIPSITESYALDTAKSDAQFNQDCDEAIMDGLYILPLNRGNAYDYRLAYKVVVSKDNPPACWVYFIDAHTGEILVKYDDIRHETLSGKVTGLILPEYPDETPQRVSFRDEYVNIVTPATQATTDSNGNYSITMTPGTYNLTTALEGPWVKVTNDVNSGINNASYTGSVTSPSTGNDINWTTGNATLEEMNVFYHVNKVHDYVKNTLEYNGMDWQIKAIVNKESSFSGGSYSPQTKTIVFSGENVAFLSHIIYHEYTHAVTESIYKDTEGLSAEFNAIGEGLSFYFASTIQGKRVFFDNVKLKYPNDMTGEPHHDAGILTASFWNMQNSFIEEYGPEKGRALADDLVHNARFGYPTTFPEYLQEILIVDDDNGTIVDGTPNSNLILPAFEQHGIFPIVDLAITYPLPGSYIRGDVDITGIVGGYFSNFPGYKLYYFKKVLPQEKQLIYSSETPVLYQGLLARWNTSILDDGIYGLELRTGNQVNCIDNIIVDNFNSAPLVETNRITRVIFPNKMLRHIIKEVIDIDEPDGPYGGDLECTALTLPEGAAFDPENWLFSWNPQESDAGKVCTASFVMADKEHAISFQIDLLVARLFQVMKSQPEEVYYYTPVIYKDKVVFVARNPSRYFDVYVYDISTQETKIVYDNGISKDRASIYGDIVIWVENNRSIKAYDIATSEVTDVLSSGSFPAIYENKIVWEDYRNGPADIYMYDISSGKGMQLDNSVNLSLRPSIYDNRVVWQEVTSAGDNICLYDINTGSAPNVIVSKCSLKTPPAIYKDKIVFSDKSFGIYLMELSSGNITQIATNSVQSKIYGNKIVWKDYRNGTQDVYMYDIVTRKYAQVTYEPANERLPNLYENKIIWVEDDKICIAILPEPDTTKPITTSSGTDAKWHNTPVTVTLTATDSDGSGVDKTYYSMDGAEPKTLYTVPFTLSNDGVYTIKYYSVDIAGNKEEVKTAPNQVKIDTTPPTGTVKINNDNKYTTSASVTLKLSATDTGSGMGRGAKMKISNTNPVNWNNIAAKAYSTPKSWTLTAGSGTKTVYVKFKDAAGNWSAAVSDSIIKR